MARATILVLYGAAVVVASAAFMPGGFILLWLWSRFNWIPQVAGLVLVVAVVASWIALARRLAPQPAERALRIRAAAFGVLVLGAASSAYSDMLFRAFVNQTDFCCMRTMGASDAFFHSFPFILAGLPLLIPGRATTAVLVCGFAAGLLTLPDFFNDDPQHGSDGQAGWWFLRTLVAGSSLAVTAFITVLRIFSAR